jgi:hypothetical protein
MVSGKYVAILLKQSDLFSFEVRFCSLPGGPEEIHNICQSRRCHGLRLNPRNSKINSHDSVQSFTVLHIYYMFLSKLRTSLAMSIQCYIKVNCKVVPLKARCDSEVSRRFRLPDSMTFGT